MGNGLSGKSTKNKKLILLIEKISKIAREKLLNNYVYKRKTASSETVFLIYYIILTTILIKITTWNHSTLIYPPIVITSVFFINNSYTLINKIRSIISSFNSKSSTSFPWNFITTRSYSTKIPFS